MPGDDVLLTIFYPEENLSLHRRFEGEVTIGKILDHIVSASHIPNQNLNMEERYPDSSTFLGSQDSDDQIWSYSPPGQLELVKVKRHSFQWLKLLFVMFLISLMSVLGGLWFYQKHYQHHYGAVFDAGSAHTSLSIYKWHRNYLTTRRLPLLFDEEITQTMECESSYTSGVSSYTKDPRNVRTYIRESPCFNRSKILVPKGTHVFFGATAGMRILKASKPRIASAIMSNITEALRDFRNVNASIISGVEEGIYGWITVNFLSRSFFNGTLGALDWGGASSQITFEWNGVSENHIRSISLMNQNFSLYVRSDLCYGKFEATRRYLALLVYSSYVKNGFILNEILESPCHKAGTVYSLHDLIDSKLFSSPCTHFTDGEFLKRAKKGNFSFKGSGDYHKCSDIIVSEAFTFSRCISVFSDHCVNPSEIPLPQRQKYVAFSTYYYYLKSIDLIDNLPHPQAYLKHMHYICNETDNPHLDSSPNSCFEGLFLHHLLTKAYHLEDWTKSVDVLQEIGNKEVGWTLGYIIHRSALEGEKLMISLPIFLLSILALLTFLVILFIIYIYKRFCSYHARNYRPIITL